MRVGARHPASRCATGRQRPPALARLCRPQVLPNGLGMMVMRRFVTQPRGSPRQGRVIALGVARAARRPRRTGRPGRRRRGGRVDPAGPSRSSPATSRALLSIPQAVTVAAQIVAAEASCGPGGRRAGGRLGPSDLERRHRRQRGRQDAGPPSAADGGRAGRAAPAGWRARAEAAARCRGGPGPAGMPALWGWAGAGPGRVGGVWALSSAARGAPRLSGAGAAGGRQ